MSISASAPTELFQTPPASYPLPASPPPIAPAARKPRPPLESAKTVLSAELFQRRHALEFAHLHSDADNNDLKAEQALLEYERRIGRMKRQSRAVSAGGMVVKKSASGRALSFDAAAGRGRAGRKPLSLIEKNECNVRSKPADIGLGIDILKNPPKRASLVQNRRPQSLQSSMMRPTSQRQSKHIPEEQALEVLVERDPSPPPETNSSEGDKSIAPSTYSWATSFSGETSDLRTAAHYVPSRADTPELEAAAPVDSPIRKEQRKQRIKAIAHTVRQLEGVGSRDMEDPTFYSVLAKAWYERFDDKQKAVLHTPNNLAPTPEYADESNNSPAMPRLPALVSGPSPDQWASPPDPEFKTPIQGYESHPAQHDYPRPRSNTTSFKSDSVRYSYASTLHDLALEGMTQGSKLMREKAWLKRASTVGTPWGGEFDGPPPLRPITPEDQDISLVTSSLDSPFEYDQARFLRRIEVPVTRQRVVSDEKQPLDSPSRIPAQGEAGPSQWGVGFVNAWWDSTPVPSRNASMRRSSRYGAHNEDFQIGEDGTIPPYQKNKKSSITQIPTSTVLEPDTSAATLTTTTRHPSLSPSDQIFIEALLRVPSRRRSLVQPNRRMQLRTRQSRHRRARSDPPPIAVMGQTRRDFIESVYLNHFLPKLMPTHSITSSPLPPAPPPSYQPSEGQAPITPITPISAVHATQSQSLTDKAPAVEVADSVEDGSIGLDNWSPRSISPLPTPPLHSDMSHSPTRRASSAIHLGLPVPPPRDIRGILSGPSDLMIRSHPVLNVPAAQSDTDEMEEILEMVETDHLGQTHGTHKFLEPGHLAQWIPKMRPTINTSNLPDDEAMSMTDDEDLPPPVTRVRSSSLPHNSGLWSYRPGTPDTLNTLDTASQTHLPRAEVVFSPTETDSVMGGSVSLPSSPRLERMSRSPNDNYVSTSARRAARKSRLRYSCYDTEAFTPPEQTKARKISKWLFYVGFVFPLLWLVGSWPMAPETIGDAEKGTRAEYMLQRRIDAMAWWRRWSFHPDPYVERCRWAAGVTIPVCIVAGVIIAIILTVAF